MILNYVVPEYLAEKVGKMTQNEINLLITRALEAGVEKKDFNVIKQMTLDSLLYMSKLESMISDINQKMESGVVVNGNVSSNDLNNGHGTHIVQSLVPEYSDDEEFSFDDDEDGGDIFDTLFK